MSSTSLAGGGGSGGHSSSATDQLPTNDKDRLLFYSEVLIANIPSLIADLSSPTYTFLSFSEKTRTEVKQKSALLQSVSRTYTNALTLHSKLEEGQRRLEKYETELVSASPPRFMTSTEALEARRKQQESSTGGSAGGDGVIMVLNDEDVASIRAAETENAQETEAFVALSKAANDMEDTFATARATCEEMTKHVQMLKTKFDALNNSLKATVLERTKLSILRDELQGRQAIAQEALNTLQALETQCRHEELEIIQHSIKKAKEEADKMRDEQLKRKEKQEVELAAYQIAYKEAQADSETLKDDVAFLKKHQKDLEALAKQQQQEESKQNSLKRLVLQTLTWSSPKRGADGSRAPLTPEQQYEVKVNHSLVSVLAANIFEMNQQRNDAAGILAQVENAFDNDAVRAALEKIQDLFEPAILLDEDALNRDQ